MPAITQGSSPRGEPERPPPPITSLPALSGTPPPMAITLGSVVCSRRTGRVAMSLMNSSVVILKVMAPSARNATTLSSGAVNHDHGNRIAAGLAILQRVLRDRLGDPVG